VPNPGNSPTHGFTLAEDAALKHRLEHLYVTDDHTGSWTPSATDTDVRVPKVFFRWPEGETEKLYPFLTIDLLDISYAPERQESERTYYFATGANLSPTIDYYPSEFDKSDLTNQLAAAGSEFLSTDQIVPVDLIYQVSTNCRSQRHDRQLTMLMMRRVFPLRRGFIEIPEDGTIRRCELLDWQQVNVLDKEVGYKKRIFRTVYTVKINAEIPQSDLVGVQQALSVVGVLEDYDPAPSAYSDSFMEAF
jgi:hypothetical protein